VLEKSIFNSGLDFFQTLLVNSGVDFDSWVVQLCC